MKPKGMGAGSSGRKYIVFLSHSSKDRWVARQMMNLIEQKCRRFGVRVFFDERDIQSGQSIPESIRLSMRDCSEFVVLFSKYSFDSRWVNLELGGAYFLRKPIIAILDKMEPSELPDLMIPYKAVDLNNFDQYLAELTNRARGHKHGKKRRPKK